MKKYLFIALILTLPLSLFASTHKLRFSLSGGYSPVNELSGNYTFCWSPKLSVTYPVSSKLHIINTELSITSLYEGQITGTRMDSIAFGFGLRVFYNEWKTIRPYFNHEILSRVISADGKSGSAKTFSVLLGLGLDIPLALSGEEVSSLFIDASYVFYDTDHFDAKGAKIKTILLTAGYSLAF